MTSLNVKPHAHSDALKTVGIEQLKPSGVDSNYLVWSFVVELHLQACRVGYVLDGVLDSNQSSSWHEDNITVCSVITKTIDSSNYRDVREFRNDARAMWMSLRAAHQDFTAGGRMYWLRKLVLYRMDDDDVTKHLDLMTVIYEKLNSLVTTANPLTPDDIFSTALLISAPASWLHSVSHLLNSPQTSSSQILACLKAESNRRASTLDEISPSVTVSKTVTNDKRRAYDSRPDNPRPQRTAYDPDLSCTFCKTTGHDLSSCKTASRVLADHKDNTAEELRRLRLSKTPSRRPEKASKTQTVVLGHSSNEVD